MKSAPMKAAAYLTCVLLLQGSAAIGQVPMPPSALLLQSQIQLNAVSQRLVAGMLTPDKPMRAGARTPDGGTRAALIAPARDGNTTDTPAMLASSYPPASRAEAQRVFRDLLDKYREVERAMELPERDLSGAAAMLIAGSYEAYHDVSIEPEQFKAVSRQVRQALGAQAGLASMAATDKLQAYEQMAILGMLLSGVQDELSRHPNPSLSASLKQAAAGYARQLLNTDIGRVRITHNGMSIQ